MDDYVGQLMQTLREQGLAENTLVLFSSDNGSTEDIPPRFAQNNRLRGFKRSPYEGGIRAPLLAWWPGKIRSGVSDHPTAQWDFLATACELAGAKIPAGTDGVSIAPTLLGKRGQRVAPNQYWEFHEQGGWKALRQGNLKLIFFVKPARYELYDLSADPAEQTNLVAQRPADVARLKALMASARTPSEAFPLLN